MRLSQNPIIIVGFPRSGTTLLQAMLATQDNICSFPETHFFCTTLQFISTDEEGYIDVNCLDAVFDNIKEKTEYEFPMAAKKEIITYANNHLLSIKMLFEYLVTGLLLKQLPDDVLSSIHWVEKTPGHIFHLDKIHALYPTAKFIEIVRNPFNAIYSSINKFDDLRNVAPIILAHQWKSRLIAFNKFKRSNPDNALIVKYESLVRDPELEIRRVAEFLNIKPNINNLNNVQEASCKLVLRSEPWKNRNLEYGIVNDYSDYYWPIKEKLKITYLLKNELIELGYLGKLTPVQRVFNYWMSSITSMSALKLLTPFKKPIKALLYWIGLWPFQKGSSNG